MDLANSKCILIIDHQASTGVIANIAAILSMSLGNRLHGLVGEDIVDNEGVQHVGLAQLPIPVLGATTGQISAIRNQFLQNSTEGSLLVDFSSLAQEAMTYQEYTSALQTVNSSDVTCLGIALFSTRKEINKLSKGLSLIGNN